MYLRKQVKRQQAKINFHPFVTERTLQNYIRGFFFTLLLFYLFNIAGNNAHKMLLVSQFITNAIQTIQLLSIKTMLWLGLKNW